MRSIQARVLALSLAALIIVGSVTVGLGYRRVVHEIDELMDAQLAQYARIMLALAHEAEDDEVRPPEIEGHVYASRLLFQIWRRHDGQDRLLLRSPEAPQVWPEGVARAGYSEARIGVAEWRVFVAASHDQTVLAALDLKIRDELARDMALGNLKPYFLGLPILGLLLALAVRQGLGPLRRIEAELARRTPEQLDPLTETDATRELSPVIQAMNRLFQRVGATLENERRFTSDAAHELRTPLAALKLQLQVAQRTADPTERAEAIAKALRGSDRMTHLVAQLLALARLEGSGASIEKLPVSLAMLVAEMASDFQGDAARRGIHIETEIAPEVQVAGNADLLAILLRNLIDNALRYVPAGGRVRISLEAQDRRVLLNVADDGPGVPTEEIVRLGQRFNRLGPQSSEGVGLGLSIVRRIAELHDGELTFGPGLDGSGLVAQLSLPL
jgi:two-component system sensor histidine kinase QseC